MGRLIPADTGFEYYRHVHAGRAATAAAAHAGGTRAGVAFTVWPVVDRSGGHVVLVDAGFYRDKFIGNGSRSTS